MVRSSPLSSDYLTGQVLRLLSRIAMKLFIQSSVKSFAESDRKLEDAVIGSENKDVPR